MWRTMTHDEWVYLFTGRPNALSKYGLATVEGQMGMIILPDNWTTPSGLNFTPDTNSYNTNVYTAASWTQMESNGAIFLPSAGHRWVTQIIGVGVEGEYWSSTYHDGDVRYAYNVHFRESYLNTGWSGSRFDARSVRLVKVPTNTPCTGGFDANGASNARFSVSSNKQVRFSRGNLQYQASTNTWRFAEHQYDCIGADNANISSTYSGWIDLFGWGTSGWNSGATCYQPWSTSGTASDYYPGGVYTNSLTGAYANADWGVYNAISNGGNRPGMWRTMTHDEWVYLFTGRPNALSKYGLATVEGQMGMIILPDNWTTPSGLNFTPDTNSYNTNVYTAASWTQMESNGAIFLPSAGHRWVTQIIGVGVEGEYWSSTYHDGDVRYAYNVHFRESYLNTGWSGSRFDARSVRLVMD